MTVEVLDLDYDRGSEAKNRADEKPDADQYAEAHGFSAREEQVADRAVERMRAYRVWKLESSRTEKFEDETGLELIERELHDKDWRRQCQVASLAVLKARADGLFLSQAGRGNDRAVSVRQAEVIREEYATGDYTFRQLELKHGVPQSVIQDVVHRRGAYAEAA